MILSCPRAFSWSSLHPRSDEGLGAGMLACTQENYLASLSGNAILIICYSNVMKKWVFSVNFENLEFGKYNKILFLSIALLTASV